MLGRIGLFGLTALVALAVPRLAGAQERKALVVALGGDDILVDAGKPAGLRRGASVSVFHLVMAKHPVTGKPVSGAFPIGRAQVLEAGSALSLLSIDDPALRARLVVGDEIRYVPNHEPERPAPVPSPGPVASPGPVVPGPSITPVAGPPGRADELESQARKALMAGNYADALSFAAGALDSEPGRPQSLQMAGVAACYLGRPDLASRYAAALNGERQRVVRQVCARKGVTLPDVLPASGLPGKSDVQVRGPAAAEGPDPKLLEELALTFGQAAGRGAEQAQQVWMDYLARNPESPFQAQVRAEIAQRAQDLRGDAPELDVPARGFYHQPAARVEAGRPLAIVLVAGQAEKPREIWLHHRVAGAATWTKSSLVQTGDGYLRGEIPGDQVQPPGVDYFAEARYGDAQVIAVVGSEGVPISVEVTPTLAVRQTPKRGRSRVSSLIEYVDFNSGGGGNDRYTMFEVDFMYRFKGPVYAMRVGLGTLQGEGGALDAYGGADKTGACPIVADCRERSFTYGYTELEFRAQKNLAVAARVYAGGLKKPDVPGATEVREGGVGFMGTVRIGEERGTNLSMSVASVSDFGTTGELKLQWGKVEKLPITGIVQATNLPAGKELGFRGAIEVGYQVTRWFYPTLRVGYNARTIRHAGFAGGLALVFDW